MKYYTDLSIDLETLSTSPKALILSIGYCFFDRRTGEVGPSDQLFVSPASQLTRDISWSTVKWWLLQDKEAIDALRSGIRKARPLEQALFKLYMDILRYAPNDVKVWGNGAEFDNVILQTAYKGKPPWKYYANNSVRTPVLMAEDLTGRKLKELVPFEGVKHDARADATHQAKLVIEAYKLLDLGTKED